MKKNYLLLVVALLLQMTAFGQEVPQEQKIVITKIAATWCPPCGGTAWDNFDVINDTYAGKAIILTAHPSRSSKLHSEEAIDFSSNLPQAFGQPLFYINRSKYTTNNILENVATSINEATSTSPLANTGIIATIKDDILEVKAKVKFFQEGDGEYYLSLLVIEDDVIEEQANRGSTASHKRVLRTSLIGGTFGQEIALGEIAAASEFVFMDSKSLVANWNTENLEVAAIIWQQVDGNYEFVNAHVEPVSFSTSINTLQASGLELTVTPNLVQGTASINIDAPIGFDKVNIALFNSSGQQIQSIFTGDLPNGQHTFFIDKNNLPSNTTSGFYFLKMESNGSVISTSLFIE